MKTLLVLIISLVILNFSCTNRVKKGEKENEFVKPNEIEGLITFWDFQEKSGEKRVSKSDFSYELEEMNGPIKRAEDGIFGPYCADLDWGQWFRAKRENVPALNIQGDDQQITMVAWIKLESDRIWQYIAGIWNEGDEKFLGESRGDGERAPSRQYAMFINGAWQTDYTNYERIRANNQTHGYVSPYGGATPDHPFAFDYATGGTNFEKDRWYMIAYTYDGEWIKVYVDGKLDSNGNYNPFYYDGPIYDGGENGADFTIAQRDHPRWPSYPDGVPEYDEGFDGKIGGLAVYNRSLSENEILKLYESTIKK